MSKREYLIKMSFMTIQTLTHETLKKSQHELQIEVEKKNETKTFVMVVKQL